MRETKPHRQRGAEAAQAAGLDADAVADLRRGERLLRTIKDVIRLGSAQQQAFAEHVLNVPSAQLSMALNGNERHFSITWLPGVLRIDHHGILRREMAELLGTAPAAEQRLALAVGELFLGELRRRGLDLDLVGLAIQPETRR